MARPGKHDHQKQTAYRLHRQGDSTYGISQALGIPRTTLIGWIKQWKEGVGIPTGDDDETAQTHIEQVSDFRQVDPSPPPQRPKVVGLEDGRARVHHSKFSKACGLFESIIEDVNQPGAVRVQAANGLLRAIALSAELPEAHLNESPQSSVGEAVAKAEQFTDEEIAQRYREKLS